MFGFIRRWREEKRRKAEEAERRAREERARASRNQQTANWETLRGAARGRQNSGQRRRSDEDDYLTNPLNSLSPLNPVYSSGGHRRHVQDQTPNDHNSSSNHRGGSDHGSYGGDSGSSSGGDSGGGGDGGGGGD